MSIKVVFIDNYKVGEPSGLMNYIVSSQGMAKHGIEVVDTIREAQIIVAHRTSCELIHSKRPIIICEKHESRSASTSSHYYSDPKVIAVFKNFMPRERADLVGPMSSKRLHYADMSTPDSDSGGKLDKYTSKFHQCCWYIPHTHLEASDAIVEDAQWKGLDVLCLSAGSSSPVEEHSQLAIDAVSSIEGDFSVASGLSLNSNELAGALHHAKIVVSPWGSGEITSMDWRAVLNESVLVKPRTPVLTTPDLFTDSTYVECKTDYSDLADILRKLLAKDNSTMTTAAKDMLMSWKKADYVREFCEKIKEIYKNK